MNVIKTPTYHLSIGEIIVCPEPSIISTVLGSCVSVCIFSQSTGMGGMIHYAHPRMLSKYGQEEDFRYGEIAIPALIEELKRVTESPSSDFVAKIVGGASEIDGTRVGYDIGAENIKVAREWLNRSKIPIVGEDVGNTLGRKILFHTSTNRLQVALINPSRTFTAPNLTMPTAPTATPAAPPPTVADLKAKEPAAQKPAAVISTAKRKVLIVDDSKVIRDLIQRILSEDPQFEIIGFAANAAEADKFVKKTKPDVITLDIHMPGITGVEWLEQLLPTHPIPVVMISSLQLQEGNEVFRALELGAVDYIQKPSISELPVVGPMIREKVKAASFAKIFRNMKPRKQVITHSGDLDLRKIIAIGASTGGTEALKVVMAGLPAKIPPIVIVQHIPPVFSKAFADRLNELCPFEVKEAEDGDELMISRVLIAPGGKQMKVEKSPRGFRVRINDDAPMNRHKPSVDYLFHSVASVIGKNTVGVILTGMGGDGAKGLLDMRQKGSKTISQDEASSVVYGMPKVAFDIGASSTVVPLDNVATEILKAVAARNAA